MSEVRCHVYLVVSHQLFRPPHIFTLHNRRNRNRRMRLERGRDFSQFNTETAHFDLPIGAAQVFEHTVRPPAHQIATAIQARIRLAAEAVGNKPLGGQRRLMQVSQRHTIAADVQLARHADRQRRAMRIQHIDTGIADGAANRNGAGDFGDAVDGCEGRGLGRPVSVEQPLRRPFGQHPRYHCRVEDVTAHDQITQLRNGRQQHGCVVMEQPGRQPQHVDGLVLQTLPRPVWRQHDVLRNHHYAAAGE